MSTEKINATAAVSDEDLDKVTGGLDYVEIKSTGKYYAWNGSDFHDGQKFLCPNCGRPVHYGWGYRYYCDPCNASWYYEDKLVPNIKCSSWKEISQEAYNMLTLVNP